MSHTPSKKFNHLFSRRAETSMLTGIREAVDDDQDRGTFVAKAYALSRGSRAGAKPAEAFVAHFAQLRSLVKLEPRPGVVAIAFGARCEWLGHLFVPAIEGETQVAIVGRHHMADLIVPPAYDAVSLRHLALLVRPSVAANSVLRVLDLATTMGFASEQRTQLRSIASTGTVFIYLGDVLLMLLSTLQPLDWEQEPAAVFAQIPQCRYEVCADNRGAGVPQPPRCLDRDPQVTHVTVTGRPLVAGEGLLAIDPATPLVELPQGLLALLRVGEGCGFKLYPVSAAAIERGMLFGRYARCNLELDHVLAIDTASSNGTAAQGQAFKVRRVDAATVFSLAGEIALVWSERGAGEGSAGRAN